MASKKVRVGVSVNGEPRVLFSLRLGNAGDVYLIMRHAAHYRTLGEDADSSARPPILGQKYSVHASPGMPETNVIKHTLEVQGEPPVTTVHFTRAVKKTGHFAPLFARRAPDLAGLNYQLPSDSGAQVVSIGAYEPSRFTLFYSVLVGAKSTPFTAAGDEPWSKTEIDIGALKIVVLASYLSLPSTTDGWIGHFTTFDPSTAATEEEREFLAGLPEGLPPAAAKLAAIHSFMSGAEDQKRWIATIPDLGPQLTQLLAVADFYPEGTRGSGSWNRHLLRLAELGVLHF